ncbi:MAG: LytTR family transcriptional regulator DNA-binding domain-containing protein [Gemmatimonadaceae bacterium]|nr:LytTR family transcriptional regulator DNA-binding domain-containing protein [Gemmatimonadaceae bacterium]
MAHGSSQTVALAVRSATLRLTIMTAIQQVLPEVQLVDWGQSGLGTPGDPPPAAVLLEPTGSELRRLWLERLRRLPAPPSIVVLGQDAHLAVTAFEVGAVDYVPLPATRERVQLALTRLAIRLRTPAPDIPRAATIAHDPAALDRLLMLREGSGRCIVSPEEIVWLEGARNYVRIHLIDRVLQQRETLFNFENSLDSAEFVRVHRSAIVNLRHVREVTPQRFHGERLITLATREQLRLSRTYARSFGAALEALYRIDRQRDAS